MRMVTVLGSTNFIGNEVAYPGLVDINLGGRGGGTSHAESRVEVCFEFIWSIMFVGN